MYKGHKFDVSPFYPLCVFPSRENKKWMDFEQKMIRAGTQPKLNIEPVPSCVDRTSKSNKKSRNLSNQVSWDARLDSHFKRTGKYMEMYKSNS